MDVHGHDRVYLGERDVNMIQMPSCANERGEARKEEKRTEEKRRDPSEPIEGK